MKGYVRQRRGRFYAVIYEGRDPVTGKETVVYTCTNQDQALDHVVWPHLAARLRQNSTQEKLTALWIAHLQQLSPAP